MNFDKYLQPFVIISILIGCVTFILVKYKLKVRNDKLLDTKDRWIISFITLAYTLLSFIHFADINHFRSWYGSYVGKSFVVKFNSPISVSKIYYYYGYGSGNLQLEYTNQNNQTEIVPFNNNLALYKWMELNLPNARLIKQLTIKVDNAPIDLNQLAIFDNQNHIVSNYKIISDNHDQELLESVITKNLPRHYQNTFLSSMYFDEVYYARTANEYLHLQSPYAWVHPPLGMLMITVGIILFGMNPFGWRFVSNLSGIALIPLIYSFAKKMFASRRMAVTASLMMVFEFMHFSLSRQASIDSTVTLFITLELYFLYCYLCQSLDAKPLIDRYYSLFYCGICFGIALATKWVAVFSVLTILPILAYCELWRSRTGLFRLLKTILFYLVVLVIIPLAIYAISYLPYFISVKDNDFIGFLFRIHVYMLDYHTHFARNITHPYASDWWSWPLLLRPLSIYFWQSDSGLASSVVLMGNPAIWWVGILAILAVAGSAFAKPNRNNLFLCLVVLSLYAPWAFVGRLTFIYYFYEVTPFWILAIVYIFQTKFFIDKPKLLLGYLLLVLVLFTMFYPALSGILFPRFYIHKYLHWFISWDF